MSSPPPNDAEALTANVEMNVGNYRLQARVTLPAGPTTLRMMLPVIQNFANALVDVAVKSVEDKGKTISCKAGCGACCRQLVPITQTEAHAIAALVEQLPEPRRTEIRRRFAAARQHLEQAGMLDKIAHHEVWSDDEFRVIGMDYFRLGIPCPFLEDESCSIHPERPVTCREYLVTSPAENCAAPSASSIDMVPLAGKVWTALA